MEDPKQRIAELLQGIDRNAMYSSIGRFIFEFSQLEFTLKSFFATLTGVPDQTFSTIMSAFDFARLCAACKVHFPKEFDHWPEQRKRMDELLSECLKMNEDRNRVVHALWTIRGSTTMAIHTSRNSFEQATFFDKPGELDQKAQRLNEIRDQISMLLLNWSPSDTGPLR